MVRTAPGLQECLCQGMDAFRTQTTTAANGLHAISHPSSSNFGVVVGSNDVIAVPMRHRPPAGVGVCETRTGPDTSHRRQGETSRFHSGMHHAHGLHQPEVEPRQHPLQRNALFLGDQPPHGIEFDAAADPARQMDGPDRASLVPAGSVPARGSCCRRGHVHPEFGQPGTNRCWQQWGTPELGCGRFRL